MNDPPEPAEKVQGEKALAEAVKDYVKKHPQSMDTVEGIAEWWIPGAGKSVTLTRLRRVLERLADEGFLDRVGHGEYAHYRARRQ